MNKQTRILLILCTLVTLFANTYSNLILEDTPVESNNALNDLFLGSTEPKFGGLHDFIFQKDRKSLIKWAITAEAHYFVQSKLNNEEPSEAWIYNRISQLSNNDLAKYVLNMAKKFPELDSGSTLDALASEYGISDKIVNFVANKAVKNLNTETEENSTVQKAQKSKKNKRHNHKSTDGINALLLNGDRLKLIKWALTAEAHLQNGHKKIEGGLHDYIHTLSNEQIAKYITIAAKNHSELNSQEKMEELAIKYGITEEIAMEKHAKGEPEPEYEEDEESENSSESKGENLHDLIKKGDRKILIKWALVAEAVLNEGNQNKLNGGLHDYVNSLSNEQLGKFVAVAAKNHPELNNRQNMEKLADEFEINAEEIIKEKVNKENEKVNNDKVKDKFLNKSNVNFSLFVKEEKDDLFSWALAAEKYDKEKHNLDLLEGGLENYITKMNKEQLAEYIVIKVRKYPELADKNYLDYLSRKYGYKKL